MPDITLTVSQKLVDRLQEMVAAHNQRTGESLTARQWAVRHLKALAAQEELTAALAATELAARAQADADVEAALVAAAQQVEASYD